MDKKIKEKRPKVKADDQFLEIKHGEMILKVPNNIHDVRLAKNFLATFEELLKELPNIPSLYIEESDEEDEVPLETEAVIDADEQDVNIDIPEPPEEKEEGIPDECPLCQSKVKTKKPFQVRDKLVTVVKCKKNWIFGSCKFKKDYVFKI